MLRKLRNMENAQLFLPKTKTYCISLLKRRLQYLQYSPVKSAKTSNNNSPLRALFCYAIICICFSARQVHFHLFGIITSFCLVLLLAPFLCSYFSQKLEILDKIE